MSQQEKQFPTGEAIMRTSSILQRHANVTRAAVTAVMLGSGLLASGISPAVAQANDPSVPCDKTSNQWGDSEFCYTGPRSSQRAGQNRPQDNVAPRDDASRARAQALDRNGRGTVRRQSR
jgi:hypothetical protein